MPSYVEVAVNVPGVEGVFHYHLPRELEGQVHIGHLVMVPFGRQMVQGVVLRLIDEPQVSRTRPVEELIDSEAVLTAWQIELAQVLVRDTLMSMAGAITLMLPPGLSQQADLEYALSDRLPGEIDRDLRGVAARLAKMLQERGPLRGSQIDHRMGRVRWRSTANKMAKSGWLEKRPVLLPPRVGPKFVRTARLACPPETARQNLEKLGREGSKARARRQSVLRFLISEPGPVDVSWIYAQSGGNLADLRYLEERGLVALGESEVWRDPLAEATTLPTEPPPLTASQEAALAEVRAGLRRAAAGEAAVPMLLHGVTGSGKTEIYLHAVRDVIEMGKQAIVLVPEIALTPQTVQRFLSRFPGRVGLLHSSLSEGERYDTWRRARSGELSVVIGPRSALFTPFPRLGLIVLDESHDDSYYQSEPPFYHARQVAVLIARLTGAVLLFGTSTPDVTSTYRAAQGEWNYLHLPSRILAHREAVRAQVERLGLQSRYRPIEGQAQAMELPPVQLVDMRAELKTGNRSIFSQALQTSLAQVLAHEQQAILFLNRRGAATYVFCRDCGYSLQCPRCDIPLTYHLTDTGPFLLCHHCNYKRQMPQTCPQCGGQRIRHYGTGTERVEDEVKSFFPQARTIRWDATTTTTKGAHEAILSHFSARRADILVGTQMLAKGLDLPMVTLVGVVLADVGLNLPDYRAGERTFQVLTQVAGRAGRSPLGGRVILQTFKPDHYVIKAAAGHNYKEFYQKELEYRRQLGYPPFAQLVRLEYRHREEAEAQNAAQGVAAKIHAQIRSEDRRATQVIGPAPCFFARISGLFRWQIILRGPDPVSLLRDLSLNDWRIEINPPSLL